MGDSAQLRNNGTPFESEQAEHLWMYIPKRLVMSQCKTRMMVIGQRSWQMWHLRQNSISVQPCHMLASCNIAKGSKKVQDKEKEHFLFIYVGFENVIWCNHRVKIYFPIILNTCESTHLNHYFQTFYMYFTNMVNYWFINIITFWGVTPHDTDLKVFKLLISLHKHDYCYYKRTVSSPWHFGLYVPKNMKYFRNYKDAQHRGAKSLYVRTAFLYKVIDLDQTEYASRK